MATAESRAADCAMGDTINNNMLWGVTKWDEDSAADVGTQESDKNKSEKAI